MRPLIVVHNIVPTSCSSVPKTYPNLLHDPALTHLTGAYMRQPISCPPHVAVTSGANLCRDQKSDRKDPRFAHWADVLLAVFGDSTATLCNVYTTGPPGPMIYHYLTRNWNQYIPRNLVKYVSLDLHGLGTLHTTGSLNIVYTLGHQGCGRVYNWIT